MARKARAIGWGRQRLAELFVIGATCGVASTAAVSLLSSQAVDVKRLAVIESDSASSFPNSSWRESAALRSGHRYGVRLEFHGAPADTLDWLGSLDVVLRSTDEADARPVRRFLAPFLRHVICLSASCGSGGVFAAFGDLGVLPGADEIRGDSVEVSVERSTSLVAVTRAPVRIDNFQLGATLGVTVPLNVDSGVGAVQRAGLNGRLQLSQLKGCSVVTGCKSFVLALPRVVLRVLAPHSQLFAGPFLMEGDFLLTVAQVDTNRVAIQQRTFEQAAEGYIRIEFPLIDFGGPLSLRAFRQGGFVTLRNRPPYWEQSYTGLRFGIDAVDVSGRQSYIEIAWGRSDNLNTRGRRRRSVVQLRVPSTEFVFQFVVNNGGRDNPVILSIFTPLDLKDIRDIILGKGKGAP